jgi:uncharacterized protein YukE
MSAGNGYVVDPAELRTAAGQVRAAGQPLYTSAAAITGQIGAAVAMNMGYETSRALSSFGNAVRQAARRVQERIDEHVGALQATADNYENTERRSEEGFKEFLKA